MSAIHNAARRLTGLLNDAEAAGVDVRQSMAEVGDTFWVRDGKLTLSVVQNKGGKWEVGDN